MQGSRRSEICFCQGPTTHGDQGRVLPPVAPSLRTSCKYQRSGPDPAAVRDDSAACILWKNSRLEPLLQKKFHHGVFPVDFDVIIFGLPFFGRSLINFSLVSLSLVGLSLVGLSLFGFLRVRLRLTLLLLLHRRCSRRRPRLGIGGRVGGIDGGGGGPEPSHENLLLSGHGEAPHSFLEVLQVVGVHARMAELNGGGYYALVYTT